MRAEKSRVSWRFRLILAVLSVAVAVLLAARQPFPVPESDSLDYLSYARTLFLTGEYAATTAGPSADSLPGREPLYPALVAVLGQALPGLGHALDSCSPLSAACHDGLRPLLILNAVLLAISAIFTALCIEAVGGGRWAMGVGAGYLLLNLHLYKDAKFAISDFLAMALVAGVSWGLARQARAYRLGGGGGIGLGLGALALTKSLFLPFGLACSLACALMGLLRWGRRGVWAGVLSLIVVAALGGGWSARNVAYFGAANDGRAAIALSTREVFDHMSADEHLAAFLWWTKGSGDDWAKRLFPPEVWMKHEWTEPEGFFNQGQVVRPAMRADHLRAEHPEWTPEQIQAALPSMVAREILAEWPSYLATMPALIYRGLWVDDYLPVGLIALCAMLVFALRRRRWEMLAAMSPGLWSALVYPAISLNTPRYQMTALVMLAMAAGWGIERIIRAVSARRNGGR